MRRVHFPTISSSASLATVLLDKLGFGECFPLSPLPTGNLLGEPETLLRLGDPGVGGDEARFKVLIIPVTLLPPDGALGPREILGPLTSVGDVDCPDPDRDKLGLLA